jgi:hypothetical protein
MRRLKIVLWVALAALVLAPAAAIACDKHKAEATTTADAGHAAPCGGCAKKGADAAALATHAKSGCNQSMTALIAKAKESGCSRSAELAAKAEGGDAEAKAQLVAMYLPEAQMPAEGDATPAQLATWAEQGCPKSASALIAAAKASGNPQAAELAQKAEGGCEKSRAALIALYKTDQAAVR